MGEKSVWPHLLDKNVKRQIFKRVNACWKWNSWPTGNLAMSVTALRCMGWYLWVGLPTAWAMLSQMRALSSWSITDVPNKWCGCHFVLFKSACWKYPFNVMSQNDKCTLNLERCQCCLSVPKCLKGLHFHMVSQWGQRVWNDPQIIPENPYFSAENTGIHPCYCWRTCTPCPPLENMKAHTSRIQVNLCTVLYYI